MTTLFVTSGGGHLQEMLALAPRLGLADEVIWAAPVSGLSTQLPTERHIQLPYLAQRDWWGAMHMVRMAMSRIRELGVERIVSTGAAPAPPFFIAGAQLGVDLHYIESAARSLGPSLSGRLISALPQAHLYTQHQSWAGGRWSFEGSIFDGYVPFDRPERQGPLRRAVVTLGTEQFGFRRAVERLLQVLPEGLEVLWQTGATDTTGLGITAHSTVPNQQLRDAITEADVVISHAGIGSALTAFDLGKRPILLAREARFGEHVDDHQSATAEELARRGLAVAVPVDRLTLDHLALAHAGQSVRVDLARPFPLKGQPSAAPAGVGGGRRRSATATGERTDRAATGRQAESADRSHERELAQALAEGSTVQAKGGLRRLVDDPTVSPGIRSRALDGLTDLLRQEGKYAECAELLDQRLRLPFDDERQRIAAQMLLAHFTLESGDLQVAVRVGREAVAECEVSGAVDSVEGVKLRATLADLLRVQGDLIAAELQIALALAAAERLGDPVALGSALWNAALISAEQDDHDHGVRLAEAAAEHLSGAGRPLAAALAGVVASSLKLDRGVLDVDEVDRQLRSALQAADDAGTASDQGVVHVQLARLQLLVGDIDSAYREVQAALVKFGDTNRLDTATALSVKAQVLARAGDAAAAKECAMSASRAFASIGAERMAAEVWSALAGATPRLDDAPAAGPAQPAGLRDTYAIPGARPAVADGHVLDLREAPETPVIGDPRRGHANEGHGRGPATPAERSGRA